MSFKSLLLTLTLGGLLAGSAAAQNAMTSGAGPGVHNPGHPRVNQVNRREQRQQHRIANGIKSGRLTPKETIRLEKQENRLERHEQRAIARNGGYLTKADQLRLNRQANRTSRHIYRAKHNAAVR